KPEWRTICEVVDVDGSTHLAANRLRARRNGEPLVQRTTLVHLEMTPADPTQRGWIDQRGDRVAHLREHAPHPGVKQERLIVLDQEMIELQVELRRINGNAEQVGCDLVNPGI